MEERSQRRTKAAIRVEIRGTDARGEAFEETLEAQDVSRRGLSVLTRRDLLLYCSLSVTIPGRGPMQPGVGPSDFFSTATVVRVDRVGDQNRLGIRFVGASLPTYSAESP
jgi:PilZ domain-containing protein